MSKNIRFKFTEIGHFYIMQNLGQPTITWLQAFLSIYDKML